MYQELILDHARHPHGRGLAESFDGESFQVNPTCGDRIQLRVGLRAAPAPGGEPGAQPGDGGEPGALVLESVSWDGQGCSISQASASMMKDLVEGKDLAAVEAVAGAFAELMRSRGRGVDQAAAESLEDAIALEGVSRYPMRVKCALLGWMALKDAAAKAAAGDASPARIPEGI
ncbi:MAG: SUF system NifU family Fe-S cluster assembly protein [Bifidobacteriaceae bacterium]|jgi:nitrogen fixation NifU-like protein|nr:SUF system NifU family Fe-S cluster assembly protein [Bifidobacteriaceae bacterium]